MTTSTQPPVAEVIDEMALEARAAGLQMARSTASERTAALHAIADAIEAESSVIVSANAIDLYNADQNGITGAMRNRLELDASGVAKLAVAVREVADQPDPLGGLEDEVVRPNGLRVARMRIPLGVIAMIYESRPNVTADAAALCLKAGNAVILRGGSEAIHTNRAIAGAVAMGLSTSALPQQAVQLIPVTDRGAIDVLLTKEDEVDLVIPRGGEGLIRAVTSRSRIPVLQHYKGVCHVYIDESAPLDRASDIAHNAKVQRPGRRFSSIPPQRCTCPRSRPVLLRTASSYGVAPAPCRSWRGPASLPNLLRMKTGRKSTST